MCQFWFNAKLSQPTNTTTAPDQKTMGRLDCGGNTQKATAWTQSNGGQTTNHGNMGDMKPTQMSPGPCESVSGHNETERTSRRHQVTYMSSQHDRNKPGVTKKTYIYIYTYIWTTVHVIWQRPTATTGVRKQWRRLRHSACWCNPSGSVTMLNPSAIG